MPTTPKPAPEPTPGPASTPEPEAIGGVEVRTEQMREAIRARETELAELAEREKGTQTTPTTTRPPN